jgi:hypothetical protein
MLDEAMSCTTSTYETVEEEILRLAKAMNIPDVRLPASTHDHSQTDSDFKIPLHERYGVDIGRCPFSWHFYGATRAIALDMAVRWLRATLELRDELDLCAW